MKTYHCSKCNKNLNFLTVIKEIKNDKETYLCGKCYEKIIEDKEKESKRIEEMSAILAKELHEKLRGLAQLRKVNGKLDIYPDLSRINDIRLVSDIARTIQQINKDESLLKDIEKFESLYPEEFPSKLDDKHSVYPIRAKEFIPTMQNIIRKTERYLLN